MTEKIRTKPPWALKRKIEDNNEEIEKCLQRITELRIDNDNIRAYLGTLEQEDEEADARYHFQDRMDTQAKIELHQ